MVDRRDRRWFIYSADDLAERQTAAPVESPFLDRYAGRGTGAFGECAVEKQLGAAAAARHRTVQRRGALHSRLGNL